MLLGGHTIDNYGNETKFSGIEVFGHGRDLKECWSLPKGKTLSGPKNSVKVAGFTSFGILGVCSNFACQSYNRYNMTRAGTEQWISEDGRTMDIQPRLPLNRIGRNYRWEEM